MSKIRILHIFNKMDLGGAETLIFNLYKKLQNEDIQFDFLVSDPNEGYYDNEIKKMGGKIHVISHPSKNIFNYIVDLKKVLNEEKYTIIHSHVHFFSGVNLMIAKWCGVEMRISHSHTYTVGKRNKIRKSYEFIMKNLINIFSTDRLACSDKAGKDLFSKNNYKILRNGIDLKKFIKHNKVEIYKRKLNIPEDSFVVGHVGAFRSEKNHEKILSIFNEVLEQEPKSILLLVGEGNQKKNILKNIKENNMEDNVYLTGNLSNVEEALFAMDVFLFPSMYEGLGIALIEAQASGLYCIASNKVPIETNITGNVNFIDLDFSSKIWSNEVLKARGKKVNKTQEINEYDIDKTSEEIKKIYNKMNRIG